MSNEPTKQVEAVYQAVKLVLQKSGRTISDKEAVYLSDYELETVVEVVTSAAISGVIQFSIAAQSKHLLSEKSAKSYCRGIVKNWLNKDIRLNGNCKYAPIKPGIRQLSKDDVVKKLKFLRKEALKTGDEDLVSRVNTAINVRLKELS